MKIAGDEYSFQDVSRVLTVPDCNVLGPNKLGSGNGEAKFYFGSKTELNAFALDQRTLECFFLKSDLMKYMQTARKEYENPTQDYVGKSHMPQLWAERVQLMSEMPEIVPFTVEVQNQIVGPRGYVNSKDKAYKLFRTLSLPLISYISIMRLLNPSGKAVYYWKLFVDFEALAQRGTMPQVFTYGKLGKTAEAGVPRMRGGQGQSATQAARSGGRDSAAQGRYRERLLEECPFCPITKISDERLLVASHIKPCAVSEADEAFDPKNGFMLSPLYDRLFDQGFISFDEKKRMMVSNWISPSTQERCRIRDGDFVQMLPLDERREFYLRYHRQYVFKG